jgi:hypothetical protein
MRSVGHAVYTARSLFSDKKRRTRRSLMDICEVMHHDEDEL